MVAAQALLDDVTTAVIRVAARSDDIPFHSYAVHRSRLGSLIIHQIESDPVVVSRRDEDIDEDRVFDFLLHVQLEGSALIAQGEIETELRPGAIAIVAGGVPYIVKYPEYGSKLILRIPHRIFHERIMGREACDFGATVLSGGVVPVIISLLKSLTIDNADELSEVEQFTVADSFLALVGSALRSRQQSVKCNARAPSARLTRILAYLEEHFSEHDLTPGMVAEANFVSVRHLHGLFQQSGTTVSRWIWDRRLRAGREDLLDPALANLTVCEIAHRRGFNDSAHFSRTFKERFGISPGHLRTKARENSARL